MIIYSEITGDTYDSVEQCLDAEYEYRIKEIEAEKAKAEHDKKCDEAYKKAIEACDEYLRLVGVELTLCEDEDEDEEDLSDILEAIIDFFEL